MRANRLGKDNEGRLFRRRYPARIGCGQGISAELIAARWGLSRERLDALALRSHERAAAAERPRPDAAQHRAGTRPGPRRRAAG